MYFDGVGSCEGQINLSSPPAFHVVPPEHPAKMKDKAFTTQVLVSLLDQAQNSLHSIVIWKVIQLSTLFFCGVY